MESFEPPKYLKDLIAAINDGAKSAQLGALAFTAIGVFLLATAFSATDEDLLLNRTLTISQLGGTAVPVVFAFGLAPAIFVAAHFYTLIRYDMLAGNVRQFRDDLAAMAISEADRHRCRQLLANVEFVNALAMPKGSRASSWMFNWTVRALLAVFPMAVLLFVQLQSLRLQSEWVNWTHHACIAADLVLRPLHHLKRLPAGDDPSTRPRLRVVGDAGEQPAQLDRGGELATLFVDGADFGGVGLSDREHARSMGICIKTGNSAGPHPARLGATLRPTGRGWAGPQSGPLGRASEPG
jgi:hypothetical protein